MSAESLISTSFGPDTTAAQVIGDIDLTDRNVIVTGGSSGIGVEVARVFASAGAAVTLAVRDRAAGQAIARSITETTGNQLVRVEMLDLADQASVAAFVQRWRGPVHVLVNNAGVMALPQRSLTSEGWEMQFATNHLGHFALAIGLHDALAADGGARIVSVTSRGHRHSPIVFEDLHYASRPYDPFGAYGQSKTANILFSVEATRRWGDQGITCNASFPGIVLETGLARYTDVTELRRKAASGAVRLKTIPEGAATTVFVAVAPELEGVGGRYFEDCNEARVIENMTPDSPEGVAAYAVDPGTAERLWRVSAALVNSDGAS